MDHTEYKIGQTWHSDRGNWKRTWSIAEIDRRRSVTLLRVEPNPIANSNARWISSGVFADMMEKHDARRIS